MKSFINTACVTVFLLLMLAVAQAGTDEYIDGELVIVHVDNKNKPSYYSYYVKDKLTGQHSQLQFEHAPPSTMHTGDRAVFHGKWQGNKLQVLDMGSVQAAPAPSSVTAGAVVTRNTLYMVVNYANATNPGYFTASDVTKANNVMFNDAYSTRTVYEEGSFGRLSFSGKAILVSITAPATCNGADIYTIANSASTAASAAGENLANYTRRMYLLPPSPVSTCNFLAQGELGSYGASGTRTVWTTANDAVAIIHELGHNEGWHHAALDVNNDELRDAGTSGEYGDLSDTMGYCCNERKFNAVHLDEIGWLPQDKVLNVVGSGTYYLEPVGSVPSACTQPDGSACVQLIKVQKASGNKYYLSYRQVAGLDKNLSASYTNGVNIHNGDKTLNIWSYFISALTDGAGFGDAANGVTVTQLSHDPSKAVVQIVFGGVTVPLAPTGLAASAASNSAINLSWADNSSDETGFKIVRSPDGVNHWTLVAQAAANATGYQDTGLNGSTSYYYRIAATKNNADSTYSASANATTLAPPPLAAPSGLGANAVSSTAINLSWVDNSADETAFKIMRSPDGVNNWTPVNQVAANVTVYQDIGLAVNTSYFYRVAATGAGGMDSMVSNTANATTTAVTSPHAPSLLSATAASSTVIKLRWRDNSNDEMGFKLERSADGVNGWAEIAQLPRNTSAYKNTGLEVGTVYFYRAGAVKAGAEPTYSNNASAKTLSPPAAPTDLTATAKAGKSILLTWIDNADNETAYLVERSLDNGSTWRQIKTLGKNVTAFTNSRLQLGKTYMYRVRAGNKIGKSDYSELASDTAVQ